MTQSVRPFTDLLQVALRQSNYLDLVQTSPPLNSAAERIAYAIERSGKTLERIAEEIGCSHVAISLWKSGKTDANGIRAGLLLAFADATGFDPRWILTGHGPQVSRYMLTSEMERMSMALKAMEQHAPQQMETILRMVEAAASRKD